MTPLNKEQLNLLIGPLNPGRVASRKQSGRSLSYLEAWDVKAMMIRTFGFGGFSADVLETKMLHHEQVHAVKDGAYLYDAIKDPTTNETVRVPKMQWDVTMEAIVRLSIPSLDVTYTESAVSSQRNPSFGDAAEFAVKTAESDAFKRAAINLGTQFGLSLYNNSATQDVVRVVFEPEQAAILKEIEAAHEAPAKPSPDDPKTPGAFKRKADTAEAAQQAVEDQQEATEPSGESGLDRDTLVDKIFEIVKERGIGVAAAKAMLIDVTGREDATSKNITAVECVNILKRLEEAA